MQFTEIDYTQYPKPRSRKHVSPNQYMRRDAITVEPAYYPPMPQTLVWEEHFANAAPPRYLDIGCGMGRFLIETALLEPEVNILGLEVREYAADWIRGVIDGERKRGALLNAQAIWYSVANGLPFIANASIEKIFYFFPDPWFKKRHHYRRAFTPAFLDECARVLVPQGTLYLMTDVPAVDEYQRALLTEHGAFLFEECNTDADWGLSATTNQEEFSRKKGIAYVRVKCRLYS
jgi:tRNA (guanine-N7-)-methyltransferase